ncbi:hypothetical protein VNO77_34488 [Canavalia gladiata]|uniref:Uncharacterized protein n=1 Tax=Canavalia gladiata TaxID=3824 RepID=A0AAN9PYK5_CANGL
MSRVSFDMLHVKLCITQQTVGADHSDTSDSLSATASECGMGMKVASLGTMFRRRPRGCKLLYCLKREKGGN